MHPTVRMLVRDVVLNGVVASGLVPRPLRWRLLRRLGASVEKSAINSGVWLGSRRLTVGRGTFINGGCRIDNNAEFVHIGARCSLAPEVLILTATHEIGGPLERAGRLRDAPVTIGDGVWIGARAVILPGVTIGDGAVIASGAVVSSDCEAHALYAGVPAVRKRGLRTGPEPQSSADERAVPDAVE